jgi:hypothetical protein
MARHVSFHNQRFLDTFDVKRLLPFEFVLILFFCEFIVGGFPIEKYDREALTEPDSRWTLL